MRGWWRCRVAECESARYCRKSNTNFTNTGWHGSPKLWIASRKCSHNVASLNVSSNVMFASSPCCRNTSNRASTSRPQNQVWPILILWRKRWSQLLAPGIGTVFIRVISAPWRRNDDINFRKETCVSGEVFLPSNRDRIMIQMSVSGFSSWSNRNSNPSIRCSNDERYTLSSPFAKRNHKGLHPSTAAPWRIVSYGISQYAEELSWTCTFVSNATRNLHQMVIVPNVAQGSAPFSRSVAIKSTRGLVSYVVAVKLQSHACKFSGPFSSILANDLAWRRE